MVSFPECLNSKRGFGCMPTVQEEDATPWQGTAVLPVPLLRLLCCQCRCSDCCDAAAQTAVLPLPLLRLLLLPLPPLRTGGLLSRRTARARPCETVAPCCLPNWRRSGPVPSWRPNWPEACTSARRRAHQQANPCRGASPAPRCPRGPARRRPSSPCGRACPRTPLINRNKIDRNKLARITWQE